MDVHNAFLHGVLEKKKFILNFLPGLQALIPISSADCVSHYMESNRHLIIGLPNL